MMSHYGLEQSVWRVTIAAAGLGGAAPADGFLDNQTNDYYAANDENYQTPTADQTLAKARANSRYHMMIMAAQQGFNFNVININGTGGSAAAAPSSLSFDMLIDRGDSVLYTPDENNSSKFLTGADALKRIIARSLMVHRTDRLVYPDNTVSKNSSSQDNADADGTRRGATVGDVEVGALATDLAVAESKVTVEKL